ncbi:ferrochelatase [Arcobacter venerupis]|uniref:Ferrochelatase n=1 Tax=Arcobacter venerupis TaxID=1054033 RepID=A0AAE7E375_9BACT|nr:ferrochelatase [Arcobacter venerupis]QKF66953.1 ferrochelatase [Arcobacter venerupis]RWS50097.1 ferrochelatase [Arcobacter venerupis]
MKRAVVLMNMGGPNNLDEVKVFLRNMFNDKYIIGAPQPIRAMIGQIIISKRLKESKANYAKLGGMSPIVGHTKRLVRRLNKELDADVFYEMRYTPPFAKDIMPKLKNYDEIYAIPMYPHYSSTTTKSSIEEFVKVAKKYNLDKKIKTIDSYYDNIHYNKAIVERIKEVLKGENSEDFELIFSAHGLTQKIIDKGDLYQKHILANVECAKKELENQNISFKKIHVAYQSRLGPMEWLRPYMEDKLKEIKSKVIIYPISFTVDNSETEYELDMEYAEVAHKIGLTDYRVAKAPNHHRYFIETIKEIYEGMK